MKLEEPASGLGTSPVEAPGKNQKANHLPLAVLGLLIIIGTYLGAFFAGPGTLGTNLGGTTLFVLLGYVLGAGLLLWSALPQLNPRTLALLPLVIVVNTVVGQIIGYSGLPLYLDSVGTIFLGVLAGPFAGAAAGILSNLIWGLMTPSVIPFSAGAALIGLASGVAGKLFTSNLKPSLQKLWFIICGAGTGVIAALVAAPVAAYIQGGGFGIGTAGVVGVFQSMGMSMLGAVTAQSLISDILDKTVAFTIAMLAVFALPPRTRNRWLRARDTKHSAKANQSAK